MRIALVSPSADAKAPGNLVTVRRWASMLRELGHDVVVTESGRFGEGFSGEVADAAGRGDDREQGVDAGQDDAREIGDFDLLVALHARKSQGAVRRYHRARPEGRVVVALTGTDLYGDLEDPESAAWWSLERADRIIVLQEEAPKSLPRGLREKTRVIYQSVPELWEAVDDDPDTDSSDRTVRVCILAHMRPVKDPFLAAEASRRLPPDSRIRIHHYGGTRSDEMVARAREEAERSPRYTWHGELPRAEALSRLRTSCLLLMTSRVEGAGNATSEAITARIPVLCTRIPGLVGMLGSDYAGYFAPGDAEELAGLLRRAESDRSFLEQLRAQVERRRSLLDPARELAAWGSLLDELRGSRGGGEP